MGLFNRKKQATERVQDLKSRVESLRKVDDEHRALTLDDFLQGDDTVTSRSEPRLVSSSSGEAQPSALPDENSLEAELQRYLQRQDGEEADALEPKFDEVVEMPDWGFEAPVSDAPQPIRPISIDEFPPLPAPEERYSDEIEADLEATPSTVMGSARLSADEEAALIAELQRYVQPEPVEELEAAPVVSNVLAAEDFSWGESPVEAEPLDDGPAMEFEVAEMPVAVEDLAQEPVEDQQPTDMSTPEPETKLVQLEGRSYEEPQPRHWPSVPLSATEDGVPAEPEPARWPKAAGDWEPL